MKKILLLLSCMMLIGACQQESTQEQGEKSVQEIQAADKISSIIRNPVSADKPVDTVNIAKISFEETSHDFGTVTEGTKVTHTFRFTNTGQVNLLISNARSTCGCTVPKWPEQPVPPGESGEIEVVFDTNGKRDRQSKPVTIFANTYPHETKVYLKGTVAPKAGK